MQYVAQAIVREWLESFKEFPPRAKAGELHHGPDRREADAEGMSRRCPAQNRLTDSMFIACAMD